MLRLEALTVKVDKSKQLKTLIEEVSLELPPNSIVGLIGESGSGKSLTAMAMGGFFLDNLVYHCSISIEDNKLIFSKDLSYDQYRTSLASLHKRVGIIPQETYDVMDPLFTIGHQYMQAFRTIPDNFKKNDKDLKRYSIEMLEKVSLGERYYNKYPGTLSGGERQRAVVGFSLISGPKYLIMDEPTAGLDWDVKKDIISFIVNLQKELKFSILIVSHDLGQICEIADRLYVMYAGTIVEWSDSGKLKGKIFNHPYTNNLFESLITGGNDIIRPVPGEPPNILELNVGCSFYERCSEKFNHKEDNMIKCKEKKPVKRMLDDSNWVRCWN